VWLLVLVLTGVGLLLLVLLTFVNVCLLISGSDSSLNSTWWMLRFLITSCVGVVVLEGEGAGVGKGGGVYVDGWLSSGHNGQAGGTLTTSTHQHNRARPCGTASPEFVTTHLYVCVFIAWCRTQPEEPEAGALIAQHAHSLRGGGITDSSATTAAAAAAAVVASDAAGAQALNDIKRRCHPAAPTKHAHRSRRR
jgi:hypothetical protein